MPEIRWPSFFREIKKTSNWIWYDPNPKWLVDGDYPAVSYGNVIPSNSHKLSLYEVNDDMYRIQQVGTALSLGRPSNDAVEYIIIDEDVINSLGIEITSKYKGTTCDLEVNDWHRDLIDFSANKMIELVKQTLPTITSLFVSPQEFEEVIAKKRKAYDWARVCKEKKGLQNLVKDKN